MTDHWFKPKTHGYGASPTNWKGWAAIYAYVAVITAGSWFAFNPKVALTPLMQVMVWLAFIAIVTISFCAICRRKTDGDWLWRWSNKV